MTWRSWIKHLSLKHGVAFSRNQRNRPRIRLFEDDDEDENERLVRVARPETVDLACMKYETIAAYHRIYQLLHSGQSSLVAGGETGNDHPAPARRDGYVLPARRGSACHLTGCRGQLDGRYRKSATPFGSADE